MLPAQTTNILLKFMTIYPVTCLLLLLKLIFYRLLIQGLPMACPVRIAFAEDKIWVKIRFQRVKPVGST